jgi:hypothetical protein
MLLAGLLPALAGLTPAAAQANDRDLRGTTVPAAACIETFGTTSLTENPWLSGYFSLTGANKRLDVRCPLPLNNIDLSGTTNDNDLSKLRVHYRDSDGFAAGGFTGAYVLVALTKVSANAGATQSTVVCQWLSNSDGTGATTTAVATKACAHDLAAGAFYQIEVIMQSSAGNTVQFLGVDFPA